jgi:ribosomal protein L20A (L18A)
MIRDLDFILSDMGSYWKTRFLKIKIPNITTIKRRYNKPQIAITQI